MEIPSLIPVLPIRNAVVFPGASMPLVVGRPRSIQAVNWARKSGEGLIVVVTQRAMSTGDPDPADLYRVGTLCRIDRPTENESGGFQLVINGMTRFQIGEFVHQG